MECPETLVHYDEGGHLGIPVRCQKTASHEILHAARVTMRRWSADRSQEDIEVTLYWQTGPERVR